MRRKFLGGKKGGESKGEEGTRGLKERQRKRDNSWEIVKMSAKTKGRVKQANEEELKRSRGRSWKESRRQEEKSWRDGRGQEETSRNEGCQVGERGGGARWERKGKCD